MRPQTSIRPLLIGTLNHNQTVVRHLRHRPQHNQTIVRSPKVWPQHNQTVVLR